MNKKGFTLIELLAVVVILLVIATIAVSSISAAIERNKEKQDITKISVITGNAGLYYQEHRNTVEGCMTVQELLDLNVITEDEATDANGHIFEGGVIFNEDTREAIYSKEGCERWIKKDSWWPK